MLSPRPVLTTPSKGPHADLGRRILIAWNGSREAARATHDALPFLIAAESVVVLTVDAAGDAHSPGANIATHLARHGVNVDLHKRTSVRHPPAQARRAAKMNVGEVILSAAADYNADLLVIGAYGHSRLRETVLGGVTRHVLSHMSVPVLMSH